MILPIQDISKPFGGLGINGERKIKLKGIRGRLVGSYFIVILAAVTILEVFLIFSVRFYYYQNVESTLTNQAEISSNFYNRYLAGNRLENQSADLLESVKNNTKAQIQIIDSRGDVLEDSLNIRDKGSIRTPDVEQALKGNIGKWQGEIQTEPVLSVAYPLLMNGEVVGIIRFITSLAEINKVVNNITLALLAAGFVVVIVTTTVSLLLAKTIIDPVRELTITAEKMAKGDFSIQAVNRYRDELGKLADTLNFMAREISKNERLKNEFIASVSHEIRTPLTSIKGWALTLQDGVENREELKEGLQIIEKETTRLTCLVEELLDFSKLEAGRVSLKVTNLNIKELLLQIERQILPRANRQGIDFKVVIEEFLPIIKADKNRIKQVLMNVIDNALKFTPPEGTINVSADATNKGVTIIVEDTGIGIKEDEIKYVTQKFYKGESKESGSGLGLSISNEIIRMHKGKLQIQSSAKGTKVTIILPC
jgi:signal transduction histidine kinase